MLLVMAMAGLTHPPSMPQSLVVKPQQQQQRRLRLVPQHVRAAFLNGGVAFSEICKATSCVVMALVFAFGVSDLPQAQAADNCTSSSTSSVSHEQQTLADISDESLVATAWELVNQFYLDARQHTWSPEAWLAEKEKVMKRPLRNRQAAYTAIRGMLSTLNDPFTRFLTPDEFMQTSKYDITGIGLNIGEVADENKDGAMQIKVLGIVLQSPAELAGIQQGDEILSVDGNSVAGKSAFEVASAIQGRKGTAVAIEARHAGCEGVRQFVVYRQQELRSPVLYRLERSGKDGPVRGYMRLKEFNALTRRDLVTALERLSASGATSFLLDLRDNLGGLVQEGIEVAKLFLEDGETVVYTARRDAGSLKGIVAKGQPLTRAPLTVLVNDRTASASEIVAAALRDNCRAILVGSKTYGKGLIQSVYEFNDGSGMVLTVGKYVTPGHVDIDTNGLEPDFRKIPGALEVDHKLKLCLRKTMS